MKTSNYKELKVWRRSIDLVKEIYKLTCYLPKEELFGISNQMKRAAVSIPSNIAEGQGRNSDKEYLKFISIANGSLYELETQTIICEELGWIHKDILDNIMRLCTEIGKMLRALSQYLENEIQKQSTPRQ